MEELESLIARATATHADITQKHEAFGEIVKRFQDMAYGCAYSVLGDFQLAEDAAQEAFIEAYQDISKLREPKAFAGWFRQIVLRQCYRMTRGKSLPMEPIEAALEMPSPYPAAAEIVEKREMKAQVLAAIQALPENQRMVTTLFYINGYSQNEIAEFLEISVTTVDHRLRASRKRLKERLFTMVQDTIQEKRPSKDEKFVKEVLEVIAPNKKEHSERIYQMKEIGKTPGTSDWRQGRVEHSHFDWETTRIGCIDDEMMWVFGVYDITMRISTARVRVASLNAEASHPDFRGDWQGTRTKLAQATLGAMRAQGYDLSISFGDEEFCYSLGYVFAWKELDWSVKTDELPSEPLDFELHQFTPEHREDLATLYNRENETLTGTAVRPTYLRNKHPGLFRGWFWTDTQGNPIGYISGGGDAAFSMDMKFQKDLDKGRITEAIRQRFEDNQIPIGPNAACCVLKEGSRWLIVEEKRKRLILKDTDKLNVYSSGERSRFWVDEAAGNPDQILRVLGVLARQSRNEEVFLDRLHYKSPLGKRLRQMVSCRIEVGGLSGNRSYVIRIINLHTLFEKLVPELCCRLKKSHLADWSGDLILSNGEEETMLTIERSKVSVVPVGASAHAIRGGQEIAQLVVGTESPDEVVEMNNLQLSGDADRLIQVLFPAQYPQMENQAL